MKKHITRGIIACTLMTSTISLSMLCKPLHNNKHLYARMCATKKNCFSLPEKNIFNAPEIEVSTNAPELLEDLYDRNQNIARHLAKEIESAQKIIRSLQNQNAIAINHTYHEESLNFIQLQSLERTLKKDLDERFQTHLGGYFYTVDKISNSQTHE